MKLTTLLTASSLTMLLVFPATAQEQIDETRQVAANEKIHIEVMRGEVTIRPGDADIFRVRGTLDERADGFTLDSDNGFTRFEVDIPRRMRSERWRDDDGGSKLSIEVPAGSSVEFEGVNTAVDVADISGSSSISTVNGTITATGLSNYVELHTVNGEITSRNNSGRIEMQSVNGEIGDNGSTGRIEYHTVNGEIHVDSSAREVSLSTVNGEADGTLSGTEQLDLNTVNGDIELRLSDSASPRIDGSTVSGDLELTLDPQISARFSLSTHAGGHIENHLTPAQATRDRYGPARHLDFSTGSGAGAVELNSVSGELVLRTSQPAGEDL